MLAGPELTGLQANAAALAGDQAGADALYAQTVDVTADMAHELVRHLRKMVCRLSRWLPA